MRRQAVMYCHLILYSLLAIAPSLGADNSAVVDAWQNRLNETPGIVYQATAVTVIPGEGLPGASGQDMLIDVRMRCDERKFRFALKATANPNAALHVLDTRGFHAWQQSLPDKWEAVSTRSLSDDSPWLNLYPFLLAHGMVPLPPLNAPSLPPKNQRDKLATRLIGGQRATFEYPGSEPVSVVVTHEAQGLIERYEVARSGKKVLSIRNAYCRQDRIFRLNTFEVRRFDSRGRLVGQLDGRVKRCLWDAQIPLADFTPPRNPDDVRAALVRAFRKTTLLKRNMSLNDLAQSVQIALGMDVRVRIDEDAFENAPEAAAVDIDRLNLQAGEATLSQVLLYDLRNDRMDFYVDPQGIVLIPRNNAWSHAGFLSYSAKNYGVTVDELRTLIFNEGTPDDWSDLGGQATILTDNDGNSVKVMHTQSDHLRFQERLLNRGD